MIRWVALLESLSNPTWKASEDMVTISVAISAFHAHALCYTIYKPLYSACISSLRWVLWESWGLPSSALHSQPSIIPVQSSAEMTKRLLPRRHLLRDVSLPTRMALYTSFPTGMTHNWPVLSSLLRSSARMFMKRSSKVKCPIMTPGFYLWPAHMSSIIWWQPPTTLRQSMVQGV